MNIALGPDVESEKDLDVVRRRLVVSEGEIVRGEFDEYAAECVRDLAKEVQARERTNGNV